MSLPGIREWRLQTYLGGLLAITLVLTFLIVGSIFLLTRIPQMEQEIRAQAEGDARELGFRIEMQMLAQQEQLSLIGKALTSATDAGALIEDAVASGKVFRALYLLAADGEVVAAGLTPEYQHLRHEILGSDLSGSPLFREVKQRQEAVWSDKYLSSLSGQVTVGLALPAEKGQTLLAEVPLQYLLSILDRNPGGKKRAIWVADQRGELLADTESVTRAGELNIYSSPVLNAVLQGQPLPLQYTYQGHNYYVGGARSPALGWFFISRLPAGLAHPEIRMTILIFFGGFLASLGVGSLLAMYGASRLLRPLDHMVEQTHQVAHGEAVAQWPRGRIKEFNKLSIDIGQMAAAILDRGRQLQELNTQLEARVSQRTEELLKAKDAAEAANRAKSTFLANMSHEIRTPLNAISGMAILMRRAGLPAEQEIRLDKLEGASTHLLEVINMVLELSKIEAGKLVLENSVFSPASLFENVCSMLHERAQEKSLDLRYELPTLPNLVEGDRTRLQQCLLNYASNAVKFTEQGSIVLRASIEEEDEREVLLRFEVSDTGIGISRQAQARLFNAFEQADGSTTRKYGGTGLGLAITAKIAEAAGGSAGVQSSEGEGSTFWFSARLRKNVATHHPQTVSGLSCAESELKSEFAGIHVLLVEDEPINREITRALLEDLDFLVDSAENGELALELVVNRHYDLILMDMQMPRMDGLEATRRIRALPNGCDFLIIAMTANAFAEDKERCLAAGMNHFITKPLNHEAFFELLLRSLRKQRDGGDE